MLCSLLHDFAYGMPRVFAAGGFPCCCDPPGSSQSVSGGPDAGIPLGSSLTVLPGCPPCSDGWIASHYLVELTGIAGGEVAGCDNACHALNGAYVVEITSVAGQGCVGVLPIAGACQDSLGGVCYRELRLTFGLPTPSLGVPVRVSLGPLDDDLGAGECSSVASIQWQAHLSPAGETLDCLALHDEELVYHSRGGALLYCDPFESKVFITAL